MLADGVQDGYGKYIYTKGEIKFGLWKSGKRIEWLDKLKVAQLEKNEEYNKLFFHS